MNSIDRILTEAMVRKALQDMKDSPARSARNLVDLGLLFARGGFQRMFLRRLQEILKNEASPYYQLLRDTVQHVEQERLLTFSMNLGYNSCTEGSRIIRQLEKEEHFDIPWAISLELCADASRLPDYHRVITQGKALGVRTWFLHSAQHHSALLQLVAAHPDCAFFLFLDAAEIDATLLEQAALHRHVMFVVRNSPGAEAACQLLRAHSMLYSLCLTCHSSELPALFSGQMLSHAQTLHPVFSAVSAASDCSETERKSIYHYLREVREAQRFHTVPWDCVYDTCSIDSVISQDSCSAAFNATGQLISLYQTHPQVECNLFLHSLRDILRFSFPKSQSDKT